MSLIKKIIKFLLLAFSITLLHILAVSLFPYPLNHINIAVSLLLLIFIITNREDSIWLAILVGIFLEIFASITYGINLISLVTSLLLTNWLSLNIFTHRSIYMVFITGIIGTFIYRLIFLVLIFFNTVLNQTEFYIFKGIIIFSMGVEIMLTGFTLFIFYIISTRLLSYLRSDYLSKTGVLKI